MSNLTRRAFESPYVNVLNIRITSSTSNFILTVPAHLLCFHNTGNYYFSSIHLYNCILIFDNQKRVAIIIRYKYLQL